MVINKVKGTAQLVFANDRVRLAVINAVGRVSYAAYVHRTKTTHQFESADAMQDFAEQMGLIPANEPVSVEQFKQRLMPFLLRMFQERCKPGDSLKKVDTKILKKMHRKFGSGDLMWESTCPELDAEAQFLFPHGIRLWDDAPNQIPGAEPVSGIEFHKPANGWTYEHVDMAIAEIVKGYGGDCTITIHDYAI
ncbi:hypothetical protein F4Z99_04040 [Candidatus Poribacteria bacterium]|nr:hypothetical protein [Candidatus Poribacteria bacterium]